MNITYLEEVESTNIFIKDNIDEFSKTFSGVYTFNQTNGIGQRNNKWIIEPGKNIALSFCLNNNNYDTIKIAFWVSIILKNVIEKISEKPTFIKWPNDIIVNNTKVCGVLIEKIKNTYVIGFGLNVLQTDFINLNKASSLYNTNPKKYDLNEIVNLLMNEFELNLELINKENIIDIYNKFLFGKNMVKTFKIRNKLVSGIILNVTEDGLLEVKFDNTIKKFRLKEIELMY